MVEKQIVNQTKLEEKLEQLKRAQGLEDKHKSERDALEAKHKEDMKTLAEKHKEEIEAVK